MFPVCDFLSGRKCPLQSTVSFLSVWDVFARVSRTTVDTFAELISTEKFKIFTISPKNYVRKLLMSYIFFSEKVVILETSSKMYEKQVRTPWIRFL